MVDNTISLRVQQLGAEGVRTRLREINNELKAGAPVTKNLKTEMRELSTQVNSQTRITRLNEQAWMANHRTLATAGRVMSSVGSIARGMLSVTTAFSVATLAFGKTNSQLAEAEAELARGHRELLAAMESGDPEKIAEAQENINIFTQRVAELKAQDIQGMATNIFNIAGGILLMGANAIQAAPKVAQFAKDLGGLKGILGNPLVWVGMAILGTLMFAIRGAEVGSGVLEDIKNLTGIDLTGVQPLVDLLDAMKMTDEEKANPLRGWAQMGTDIMAMFDEVGGRAEEFWTISVPLWLDEARMAHKALAEDIQETLATHFQNTFDIISNAFRNWINTIIDGINRIIEGANELPGINIATIAHWEAPKADILGGFGTGNFRGISSGGGGQNTMGGGGGNVYITIHGDVSGEELVDKVRMALKDNLRGLGYTGF